MTARTRTSGRRSKPLSKELDTVVPDGLGGAVRRQLRQYFAAHDGSLPPSGLYDRILQEVERPLLEEALRATGGNQLKAAQLLGLNRNTLRKKLLHFGLLSRRVTK